MSNTGRIAIDDNAVMHKFNRREYIGLELTEYLCRRLIFYLFKVSVNIPLTENFVHILLCFCNSVDDCGNRGAPAELSINPHLVTHDYAGQALEGLGQAVVFIFAGLLQWLHLFH